MTKAMLVSLYHVGWARRLPHIKDILLVVEDKEAVPTYRNITNCPPLCSPQPCCLHTPGSIPIRTTKHIYTVIFARKQLRATTCELWVATFFRFWNFAGLTSMRPSYTLIAGPHIYEAKIVKLVYHTNCRAFHCNCVHDYFFLTRASLTWVCPWPNLWKDRRLSCKRMTTSNHIKRLPRHWPGCCQVTGHHQHPRQTLYKKVWISNMVSTSERQLNRNASMVMLSLHQLRAISQVARPFS